MPRLLVGCEESQVVTMAFREIGWDAFSCDIKPTSGLYPEFHIQDDLLKVLNYQWDMMIAFPPCTYLSNAGATSLRKNGVINQERMNKAIEAKHFFMTLYNADIPRICLENPVPGRIHGLPCASQLVDHFMFGSPYTKRTYLWLRNLPILMARDICVPEGSWVYHGYKQYKCDRATARSKTCLGLAQAMAEQWGRLYG